jgi:hypothetical protein
MECKIIYLGVKEILPKVKVIQRRTGGRRKGYHLTVIVDVRNSTEVQEVEGIPVLILCRNRFRDNCSSVSDPQWNILLRRFFHVFVQDSDILQSIYNISTQYSEKKKISSLEGPSD